MSAGHAATCSSRDPSCFMQAGCDCGTAGLADDIAHDLVAAPDDSFGPEADAALDAVDSARAAALACLSNGGTVDDARQAAAERLADMNGGEHG